MKNISFILATILILSQAATGFRWHEYDDFRGYYQHGPHGHYDSDGSDSDEFDSDESYEHYDGRDYHLGSSSGPLRSWTDDRIVFPGWNDNNWTNKPTNPKSTSTTAIPSTLTTTPATTSTQATTTTTTTQGPTTTTPTATTTSAQPPTTTSATTVVTTAAPASTSAASQTTTLLPLTILMCMRNCPVTSEYNPVCGSNNVTYNNPGRLLCAKNCGVNVDLSRQAACNIVITQATAATTNTPSAADANANITNNNVPPTRFTTVNVPTEANQPLTPVANQASTVPADVLANIFNIGSSEATEEYIDIRFGEGTQKPGPLKFLNRVSKLLFHI